MFDHQKFWANWARVDMRQSFFVAVGNCCSVIRCDRGWAFKMLCEGRSKIRCSVRTAFGLMLGHSILLNRTGIRDSHHALSYSQYIVEMIMLIYSSNN